MPLSKAGKKVLRQFEKEYGKEKGKRVFYAYEKTHRRLKWLKHKQLG